MREAENSEVRRLSTSLVVMSEDEDKESGGAFPGVSSEKTPKEAAQGQVFAAFSPQIHEPQKEAATATATKLTESTEVDIETLQDIAVFNVGGLPGLVGFLLALAVFQGVLFGVCELPMGNVLVWRLLCVAMLLCFQGYRVVSFVLTRRDAVSVANWEAFPFFTTAIVSMVVRMLPGLAHVGDKFHPARMAVTVIGGMVCIAGQREYTKIVRKASES